MDGQTDMVSPLCIPAVHIMQTMHNNVKYQLTWISSVCPWWIIQNKYTSKIPTDCWQVLGITAQIWCAVLPIVTSPQNPTIVVKFVCYRCTIYLHACRKHNQLIPLRHLEKMILYEYTRSSWKEVNRLLSLHYLTILYQNVKVKIYKTIILPVVLYGCETWSLTLREENRLRVFEKRVLSRIFGPEGSNRRMETVAQWGASYFVILPKYY
jgi:hypothetical protein